MRTQGRHNRLDALRLERLREAEGLGSFLGGRIRLFPHQLYAAERACATDKVRWLLADGVGLGKTVEACLIMNRLIHTGRAERTMVVAPDALTVQWLGELWRKHHHTFVLLDDKRIVDVEREQAGEFNPFEVHTRVVVAIETLCADPRLVPMAVEAGIDLLVVDEAHHLQRPQGHPGNLAYRAIAPIAALGRNVLLLTATPLEDDALGFLRLVELLRPEEFEEEERLLDRLEDRTPLPPCTSATRAVDEEVFGLLALFKRDGDIEVVAVDARGRVRPDLAEALTALDCDLKPADGLRWVSAPGWGDAIRRMAATLPDRGVPQALAAFRVNPRTL